MRPRKTPTLDSNEGIILYYLIQVEWPKGEPENEIILNEQALNSQGFNVPLFKAALDIFFLVFYSFHIFNHKEKRFSFI